MVKKSIKNSKIISKNKAVVKKQINKKTPIKSSKRKKTINTSLPVNKVLPVSNANKAKNLHSKVLANVLEVNTKIRKISLFEFNEIVARLIQKAKLRKRNRNTLE
jgi:hypothetical protein